MFCGGVEKIQCDESLSMEQNKVYRVLIVEDDFRIAQIHQQLVEKNPQFQVVQSCRGGAEAIQWLALNPQEVDLAFLDVYLPDVEGLSLLWELRRSHRQLDIVMLTAAKEVETVEEALRAGVFDFLIKPIQADRLHSTLDRFLLRRMVSSQQREFSQEQLDQALAGLASQPPIPKRALPKGVDGLSLQTMIQALDRASGPLTASEIGEQTGTSRSTARRYLEYMVGNGLAVVAQAYGEVGRPQRLYQKASPREVS
jgi:CitB family two-component system response regulator CitT